MGLPIIAWSSKNEQGVCFSTPPSCLLHPSGWGSGTLQRIWLQIVCYIPICKTNTIALLPSNLYLWGPLWLQPYACQWDDASVWSITCLWGKLLTGRIQELSNFGRELELHQRRLWMHANNQSLLFWWQRKTRQKDQPFWSWQWPFGIWRSCGVFHWVYKTGVVRRISGGHWLGLQVMMTNSYYV